VIGRTVEVNGTPLVIVGVMRAGFGFPQNSDLWQPLAQRPGIEKEARDARGLGAMGRLAAGIPVARATTELDAVVQGLARQYPATNADVRVRLRTFAEVQNGGYSIVITATMLAVGFVLLIACANVAGLLLARSMRRTHEIATRAALGATRWRLVRQLLVESVLLAAVAGPIGLCVALAGVLAFDMATASLIKPYWVDFSLDLYVVAFLAAITLGTGLVFGVIPAAVASNANLVSRMKIGDRRTGSPPGATKWSHTLVALELALTLTLLAGAGLVLRSVRELFRADEIVAASELITLRFALPAPQYPTPAERLDFTRDLEARVRALPGVASATISSALPFTPVGVTSGQVFVAPTTSAGDELSGTASSLLVSPSYFETMGIALLRGTTFDAGESARDQAVVNQQFVSTFLPGQDPIGRRIRFAGRGSDPNSSWLTIVGASPTIRYGRITEAESVVYRVESGAPAPFGVLIVRSRTDAAAIGRIVRIAAQELDPRLPLFGLLTMERVRAQMRWQFPIFGTMLAIFAGVALLLAGLGLYAVVSAAVSVRIHEIGVRRALGAQAAQVWWMVIRRVLPAVIGGLALGLATALVAAPALQGLLIRTSPTDGPTLVAMSSLLVAVALAACGLPAWRATRVDPIAVLRRD